MKSAVAQLVYGVTGTVSGAAIGVATAMSLRPYLLEHFGVNEYSRKIASGEVTIDFNSWPLDFPLHTYIPYGIAVGIIATGIIGGTLIGTYFGGRTRTQQNDSL